MDYDLILPALLVIAIHGAGHVLGARLCGLRPQRIRLTPTGLRLISDGSYPSFRAEALVALSGPLANLLTALLVALLPRIDGALFVSLSLYLACLNLLPLHGFDGASVLRCALCAHHPPLPSLSPQSADRVLSVLCALFLFLLWMMAVYLLLRRGSALSLYLFCLQLFRCIGMEKEGTGPS
jgi:Zn-dependent protease